MSETKPPLEALVLDAHPLITQHVNTISTFASSFFVSPSVLKEIKDENARRNLELWKDTLKVRHPKAEFVKKVSDFAKLTGDFSVLSANDIHIIALTYELEVELNGTSDHLRSYPGEKKTVTKAPEAEKTEEESGWQVPKKKGRRRGGKKQRAKREAQEKGMDEKSLKLQKELEKPDINEAVVEIPSDTKEVTEVVEGVADLNLESEAVNESIEQPDLEAEEDDEEAWITADNLIDTIKKDNSEQIQEAKIEAKVALSSQDFAVQNVAIQIGLKLMNISTGLQIKRIRNYMMRCHACFRLQPLDGSKHFCAYCGGETLLRCTVVVDSKTGDIKPILKKNFEWHNKGNRFSLASPLSKATRKKLGKAGFQHNKESKNYAAHNNGPILREDQKEYAKAIKNEEWSQRQNEKFLENWIGGGSADNFFTPFANGINSNRYHSSVKVGAGRYVNASKRK